MLCQKLPSDSHMETERERDGLCRSRQVDGWIFLGASCGKVRGQPAFSREFLIREKPQKFLRQNGSSLRAAGRGTGAPGEAPLVNLSFKARDGRIYGSALPNATVPHREALSVEGRHRSLEPRTFQTPTAARHRAPSWTKYMSIYSTWKLEYGLMCISPSSWWPARSLLEKLKVKTTANIQQQEPNQGPE